MTPTQRREAVATALAAVKAHCMCAQIVETPLTYLVAYPPGFRWDGCQVSKGSGKAAALKKLLEKMELHWRNEL